jgi:hypothetical protein
LLWHYNCPECQGPLQVEWDEVKTERVCGHCRKHHFAPTPAEDHMAYVGSDRWPRDMADAVLALRGEACVVPGCFHEHTTFVHRKPESRGGHTSVDNLLPMCARHAREKGQHDYDTWLRTLPRADVADKPVMEITLTALHRDPEPGSKVQTRHGTSYCQTIAHQGELGVEIPADLRLVTHTMFIPGPACWLVLKYDWRFGPGESCGVVLMAWAASERPDFTVATGPKRSVAANTHQRKDGEVGSSRIALRMRPETEEVWHAAVFIKVSAGTLNIDRWVLAATD